MTMRQSNGNDRRTATSYGFSRSKGASFESEEKESIEKFSAYCKALGSNALHGDSPKMNALDEVIYCFLNFK